jgi:hypothetical protein
VSFRWPHGSPDHLGVKSLDGTAIAGYSRGIGQDFPRLAFDVAAHAVVFVWNDASSHPLGDIWLRSAPATLTTLGPAKETLQAPRPGRPGPGRLLASPSGWLARSRA